MRARVVRMQSREFQVEAEGKRFLVVVPKKLRYQNPDDVDPVAVGDWLEVDTEQTPAVVSAVEARGNALKRPASGRPGKSQVLAANVDRGIIVLSAKSPKWKPATLDRYLVMASASGIPPVACINKVDLDPKLPLDPRWEPYRDLEIPVVFTSTLTREGIPELASILKGGTAVVMGPSGAGKSSLINALDPQAGLRVGDVSERTDKGQHTTTWVEMIPLQSGGAIVDSPGIRVLDLTGVPPEHLSRHFPEFVPHINQCKFRDCWHVSEPACAVREAVGHTVAAARYDSYLRILKSLESGRG